MRVLFTRINRPSDLGFGMRKLAKEIYAARREGRLPPIFSPKDVASACPGWSKVTYGVFLPKHRAGNPGGEIELFERVAPGLYRILSETEKTYVFRAEVEQDEDGRWSSWIDALPGCAAWGYSQVEALKALNDAAEAYIEDMMEVGEEIPKIGVEVIEAPVVSVTV